MVVSLCSVVIFKMPMKTKNIFFEPHDKVVHFFLSFWNFPIPLWIVFHVHVLSHLFSSKHHLSCFKLNFENVRSNFLLTFLSSSVNVKWRRRFSCLNWFFYFFYFNIHPCNSSLSHANNDNTNLDICTLPWLWSLYETPRHIEWRVLGDY